jgi:DNA-binding NarL/FixJ family response regulator
VSLPRVLIVDDHSLFRAGVRAELEPLVDLAGEAGTVEQALTPREREVLQHIARGYMYKEIALRLDISPKTVEAHVSSVLRKLQLSSRHELTRWAAERRLVD